MLGKLFKYEFRATGRLFLPMYAVLLAVSVVARLFYSGGLRDVADGMAGTTVRVVVTLIMIMLFTAVWVITLVIIIRRFWTNILGREGYLMNVLPVSPWEHVFSKAVTSAVWIILSGIVSAAAMWIMLGSVLEQALNIRWSLLAEYWTNGWAYLRAEGADTQAVLMIIQTVAGSLLGTFSFILTAYAAMCIGQMENKHRGWASVGSYLGLNIVHSILNSTLLNARMQSSPWALLFGVSAPHAVHAPPGEYDVYSFGGVSYTLREMLADLNLELLFYCGLTLAVCATLFFLSQWLLKRRLNLQ